MPQPNVAVPIDPARIEELHSKIAEMLVNEKATKLEAIVTAFSLVASQYLNGIVMNGEEFQDYLTSISDWMTMYFVDVVEHRSAESIKPLVTLQ